MDYSFTKKRNQPTPQSKPIAGRESEMTKNLAGGYSFKADDWMSLKRWLVTGSMSGAFYQNKEEMTKDNLTAFERCMKEDPVRVGQEIVNASKVGINMHTPIFATVLLSNGDKKAKDVFKSIFPEVMRTASHLYEAFNYIKGLRGLGSVVHKAGLNWLNEKSTSELEYQFLKYQGRYDWSGRDILRLLKPKTSEAARDALYAWMTAKSIEADGEQLFAVVGSGEKQRKKEIPSTLERIRVYERLKSGTLKDAAVVEAIEKYNLTHEMIPANVERTKKVWEALFKKMPLTATIRNLGNLTEKGVFADTANLDLLEQKFNLESVKKAYIHPINVANALVIYQEGGILGKSKLNWRPIPRVVDLLEDVIDLSFDNAEPTGKSFFHALDVSGSMSSWRWGGGNMERSIWLEPYQIEGVMALATVRAEKNYFIGGFDTNFTPMNITKKTSYQQVVGRQGNGIWPGSFGGTDASAAYDYAIKNNIKADVFVFWTDNESWAGYKHPSQALAEYRNRINPNAKAIYVTIVAYGDRITLVDPKDSRSYDIAGFSSETPKLIQLIANDDL